MRDPIFDLESQVQSFLLTLGGLFQITIPPLNNSNSEKTRIIVIFILKAAITLQNNADIFSAVQNFIPTVVDLNHTNQ